MRWDWWRGRSAPTRESEGKGSFRVKRRSAGQAAELVSDCEAFLSGRLAEVIEARAEEIPVWTWTNLLAHGRRRDLYLDHAAHNYLAETGDEWHRTRAVLAGSVLDLAERGGSLEEVQERVLVPLELELAERSEVERWGPDRLMASVERALGPYRRRVDAP